MSTTPAHYGTIEEADTYHLALGNADWPTSGFEAERTSALIRATQYVDGYYRARFPGVKTGGRTQALEWPRTGARDITGTEIDPEDVPQELLHAVFEAALREYNSPGILTPDQEATSGAVRRTRERVGPLEEETEFFEGGTSSDPVFRRIDYLLSGLVDRRVMTRSGALMRL